MFNFLKKKPPVEEKPPTQDQFAAMLIEAATKAGFSGPSEYDSKTFTVKQGSGRTFLGNFYNDYLQAKGEHRERLLSNFVAMMNRKSDPVSLEDAKSKVVVAVREQALFSFTSLHWEIEGGTGEPKTAFEPISEWLTRCLVLDFPEYVSMVMEDDLKRWGISFDELFEIGLARLQDCTTPKFQQENGYFRGAWGDDYDSSRLLLPDLFNDLPLDGDPVVCVPNRNVLLVSGSNEHEHIRAMVRSAEEIVRTKSRPINPSPLVLKNGSVLDFSVPENSPIFNDVGRAKRLSALLYYQQQQENLDKLYQQKGKDHFVAKYTLKQLKDGGYASYTVWSKTVRTLLPKTDLIAFFDPQRPETQRLLGTAKWEDVVSIAGDLMLDTQMFPPRFYVSNFPTDEQLAAILHRA